ncbi:MAG: hypothetical protein MMC23_009957 [Stictis urceolatum]|nr:hypothetical protein [Stictis urceolata]
MARTSRRAFSNSPCSTIANSTTTTTNQDSNWQQRSDLFPADKTREFDKYPLVNADMLKNRKQRPKRVKLSLRDFIEDSLYNPHYGYFSKHAVIFSPRDTFDFNRMKTEAEFHKQLGHLYTDFEDKLDLESRNDARQLWHTPTELFRPYYGEAIARYLVENYKLSHHPYHDLIIYEMGAGNGTLMLNILDHIRDFYPEVYERTKFKIIEISPAMASLQTSQLAQNTNSQGHQDHVDIVNRSIFEWDAYIPEPCYFIALEVFDNFAHDSIRYDLVTEEPLQGQVLIDGQGEFYEFYTPGLDAVASRFLRVRDAASGQPYDGPLRSPRLLRSLRAKMPFAPNLTTPEYIPSRLMQFFDILHRFFPLHRLLASDFHSLSDTVRGYNAPVVQTRYRRKTVPVTTPLVHQGFFDILFPTNFQVMEEMYRAITGKLTRVSSHEGFLRRWAYIEDTRTTNGENPMLTWYKNASVMITV